MSKLRKWFGPSREEIWRKLCSEIEAQYIPGTFWKGDKVVASHREWTITLDIHVVHTGKAHFPYTRLRAPYVNPDNFKFTIYRKSVFTDLGKFLGMQDITVGYREFDDAFVIKGNDRGKVVTLFQNDRLRDLIFAQPEIRFSVKDSAGSFGSDLPDTVDNLEFMVGGFIKDTARLRLLFDLFAETLDELCRIGSAYETSPDVKL